MLTVLRCFTTNSLTQQIFGSASDHARNLIRAQSAKDVRVMPLWIAFRSRC